MARPKVSWMRIAVLVVVALLAWWGKRGQEETGGRGDVGVETTTGDLRAGDWVEIAGRVKRLFRDDTRPPRHQRFLIEVESGRTLLVAHNIDLAPRVPLAAGDDVVVRGEYEPNSKGGVIHWTHRDPDGRRPGGWVQHEGRKYK